MQGFRKFSDVLIEGFKEQAMCLLCRNSTKLERPGVKQLGLGPLTRCTRELWNLVKQLGLGPLSRCVPESFRIWHLPLIMMLERKGWTGGKRRFGLFR